jgi:hypothetical protein
MKDGRVVVSVVSHAQGDLLAKLLDEPFLRHSMVVTNNVTEVLAFSSSEFNFLYSSCMTPDREDSAPITMRLSRTAIAIVLRRERRCVLTSDPFPEALGRVRFRSCNHW